MEISSRTNTPFNSGNNFPDGVVGQAAVDMHGTVNRVAASADAAAGAVKPAIARVARIAHQTVDKVADVAAPGAAWLATQRDNLASTQRNAVADARVYVAANPWQSLGVALAAGFLIGRWAR